MKILITLMAFILASHGFIQEEQSNHSKWTEVRNGSKYKMEVVEAQLKGKQEGIPHVSFSIDGDLKQLEKVALLQKGKLMSSLNLSKNAQEISVEPGNYTFKFYHKNMGEKDFEVCLKKGDSKTVKLNLR